MPPVLALRESSMLLLLGFAEGYDVSIASEAALLRHVR
jgi:hypothetical protein